MSAAVGARITRPASTRARPRRTTWA